jgi:hypothetical protein
MARKKPTPAKATKAKKKAPRKAPKMAKTKAQKAAPKKVKKAAPKKKRAAVKAPVYAHVFDNPVNVKKAIYVLFAICGVSLVLDFFVNRHVDHPWEGLFGFYAVYGFVACVLLVLAAKEMRKFLMRKEDYYDD